MAQVLDFVVIDAMTDTAFKGNPTPVFIFDHLKEWPAVASLQKIARELNQSETIFVKRESSKRDDASYFIRSFTPYKEEPFCGHGLMAAAILLKPNHPQEEMSFRTVDGILVRARSLPSDRFSSSNVEHGAVCEMRLEMPSVPITEWFHGDNLLRENIATSLGIKASQVLALGRNALMDLVIELDSEVDFSAENVHIDAVKLMDASPARTRSQIVTSRGDKVGADFLKRVFAYGSEDQATGSTYCVLIPYWSSKLNKSSLRVKQVSERTGVAEAETVASAGGLNHVAVKGSGVKVMEGRILVPGIGSGRSAKL